MKTLKSLVIIIFCFIILSDCKKSVQYYTVSGRCFDENGNAMTNVSVTIDFESGGSNGAGFFGGSRGTSKLLSSSSTDNSGHFSLTYPQTSVDSPNSDLIMIFGNSNSTTLLLSANKNLNSNYSFAPNGKIAIVLKTQKSLQISRDTLFLICGTNPYFPYPIFDTITKSQNGLYKVVRVQTNNQQSDYIVAWGINNSGRITAKQNYYSINSLQLYALYPHTSITGDPIVDTIVVNY